MQNLNLLFNKTYYEKIKYSVDDKEKFAEDLKKKNEQLFRTKFLKGDYQSSPLEEYDGFQCFYMKTTYPGLLVGTGYGHGSGKADEDINLGFSFDYTTGQPYIPGSTVKGVLKSAFSHPEVIHGFLSTVPQDKVPLLLQDIFEENRDVFLDAVVFRGDQAGKLLGPDNITPHKEEIKNPVPLLLLKILPEVIFEFRFILQDSELDDVTVTAEEKKELFVKLLQLFGIGAKTNVGYGVLEEISEKLAAARPFPALVPASASNNRDRPAARTNPAGNPLKVGTVVDGVVTGIKDFGAFVRIEGTGKSGLVHISEIAQQGYDTNINEYVSKGQSVRVKIIKIKPDGNISLSMKRVQQQT